MVESVGVRPAVTANLETYMVLNCTPRPEHFGDEDLTSVALDLLNCPPADWAGMNRKWWEWALVMKAARDHGMLDPQKTAFGIASGNEAPVFALSKRMRLCIATDMYGATAFVNEADPGMLRDPGHFCADFDRNGLIVASMDARKAMFGDESFDFAFSCSSVEHFGSEADIIQAMREAYRVLRPGGVYALSVDYMFRERFPAPRRFRPGALGEFLTASEVRRCIVDSTPFELDAPIDFEVRDEPFNVYDLGKRSSDSGEYLPHLWISRWGSLATSLFITLVKR